MTLKMTGGPGTGTLHDGHDWSSLNVCTHATDGSWRLLYAGGSPFVNLDLLVGPVGRTAWSAPRTGSRPRSTPGKVIRALRPR